MPARDVQRIVAGLDDGWKAAGALMAAIDAVAQTTADQAAVVSALRLRFEQSLADAVAESVGQCRQLEQTMAGLSRSITSMREDMILLLDSLGAAASVEVKWSHDRLTPPRALANMHLARMSAARRQIVFVMWDDPAVEWSPRAVWLRLREDLADAPSVDSVRLTMRRMAADKRMQLERVGRGRYRLGPMLRLESASAV